MLSFAAFGAPTVHTSDFINNASRTNFVDFEPIGSGSGFAGTFSQDGIKVNQVNGQLNDIWSSCEGACWYSNSTLSWYPNGGDHGWTELSKTDASDFSDIGLDIGSIKFGYSTLQYELLDNGVSLLLGFFTFPSGADGYIGFSGGGFDTVRLRANSGSFGAFGDNASQALAIDNIELAGGSSVPEPTSLALLGLGLLAGLGVIGRRKS
ncbi:PEP-CTERM sorting domain-containing protein [Candidatus Accumulibacter sp. ACC003]|uniref:PEP-CTERM sorting domain-containing protein n=1 Tax=Candidatus Accumulibacter sp. ACC003 TaxID=2823334 RepID=UPI0025BD04C7|nr:PEP-CTERM sorting domain-containing protein [Candidatus Accumulibacter sp. ACC003]